MPLEPEPALVERLRGELPELPADAIRASGGGARRRGRLGARHHRPRSCVRGAWWPAASPSAEAFNFAMNQPIPAGANLAELAKVAKAAKEPDARGALSGGRRERRRRASPPTSTWRRRAVSDTAELEPMVEAVLAANPGQVEAYRGGKEGLLGFFVGQVMKETGGKANPKVVNELAAREAGGA